jgi:hypothetical protein
MRRLFLGWLILALPVFVACVALSGCKRVEDESDSWDMDRVSSSKKAGAGAAMTPIKMGKGVIKGRVVWKGPRPNIAQLDEARLKAMAAKKDDEPVCLNKECMKDEKTDQRYRIGNNNGVGNVVVWVFPDDKNSYFSFTDADLATLKEKGGPLAQSEKMISQPHCAFLPHIEWAFTNYLTPEPKNPRKTKPTGQVVKVENNSTISHNTKWPDTGRLIRSGNLMLPPKTTPLSLPLVPEAEPVRIQCSIHEWMDAYIWDFNHPYVAITKYNANNPDDEAYGTYEIHYVPTPEKDPKTDKVTPLKLKIVAWHEEPEGFVTPDQKIKSAQVIEVPEDLSAEKPLVMPDIEIVGK